MYIYIYIYICIHSVYPIGYTQSLIKMSAELLIIYYKISII